MKALLCVPQKLTIIETIKFLQHELMTKLSLQVREDIMEQSMVYEGYVKSEGIYQGEGRLLFKNGKYNLCKW